VPARERAEEGAGGGILARLSSIQDGRRCCGSRAVAGQWRNRAAEAAGIDYRAEAGAVLVRCVPAAGASGAASAFDARRGAACRRAMTPSEVRGRDARPSRVCLGRAFAGWSQLKSQLPPADQSNEHAVAVARAHASHVRRVANTKLQEAREVYLK
jgi:hypothetical protein